MRRMLARCRGLGGDNGNALVELALAFSFLGIPLLLGRIEMGYVVYDSVEISNAASAGALYGMQSPTYADAANIPAVTSAAQAEAPDFGSKLAVTPITYYACSLAVGGTQYPIAQYTQAQALAKCTGGSNHAVEMIQVVTSASATPPVHCPGLPKTFTLSGTSVLVVEQ
jgi:Flp pilus assembly protein TadG